MSLSDKIDILNAELEQRQKAQNARTLLQNVRSVIIHTNIQIQAIAASGSFNTLDPDVKNALIAAAAVSTDTETAFEDTVIAELLNWSP